jgi:hypothetical protein
MPMIPLALPVDLAAWLCISAICALMSPPCTSAASSFFA